MPTDRLGLPTLAAAQAQKEMTHNEALTLLDAAVQAVVVAVAPVAAPSSPTPGQCWIVGAGASGAWAGHDGALAVWTDGGWRFVAPFDGMTAWSIADGGVTRRIAGAWPTSAQGPVIADPRGGGFIDLEARGALSTLLGVLRAQGVLKA